MATFTSTSAATTPYPANTVEAFDLDLFARGALSVTSSFIAVSDATFGYGIVFTGSFTLAGDLPVAGTITGLQVQVGSGLTTFATATGLSADVTAMVAALQDQISTPCRTCSGAARIPCSAAPAAIS